MEGFGSTAESAPPPQTGQSSWSCCVCATWYVITAIFCVLFWYSHAAINCSVGRATPLFRDWRWGIGPPEEHGPETTKARLEPGCLRSESCVGVASGDRAASSGGHRTAGSDRTASARPGRPSTETKKGPAEAEPFSTSSLWRGDRLTRYARAGRCPGGCRRCRSRRRTLHPSARGRR